CEARSEPPRQGGPDASLQRPATWSKRVRLVDPERPLRGRLLCVHGARSVTCVPRQATSTCIRSSRIATSDSRRVLHVKNPCRGTAGSVRAPRARGSRASYRSVRRRFSHLKPRGMGYRIIDTTTACHRRHRRGGHEKKVLSMKRWLTLLLALVAGTAQAQHTYPTTIGVFTDPAADGCLFQVTSFTPGTMYVVALLGP